MPITYQTPGSVTPYGNERTNPEGSPYPSAAPTAMGAYTTSDLERAIFEQIFDTKPSNYFDSLKLMVFNKRPVQVPDDVYSWKESPMQRMYVLVDDGASAAGTQLSAAQNAAAGTNLTATVPVGAAQLERIPLNHTLMFAGGVQATVYAKGATTITIKSLTGEGLPAIIQGARLPLMGESVADGSVGWKNTERGQKITRTNYVGTYRRGIQYGRKEWAKLKGNARNNNIEVDHRNIIEEIKFDAVQNMWYGRKAPRLMDDGKWAKGMDGVYTQMKSAGSTFAQTTPENLVSTFEANVVATNQQSVGGKRTIYARSEWNLFLSKAYKETLTRYKNTDHMVDLDINQIRIAGQAYDLVDVDIFGDENYFTKDCANRIFILDDNTIDPVQWDAFPMFDLNRMADSNRGNYENLPSNIQDNIQRQDFSIRDAELNFSLRMIEPRKSLCIEVN